MGNTMIMEQENMKGWIKIIPHETMTKWNLERVQKSEDQKIREDNKRTAKLTQIRCHILWKGNTKLTHDFDKNNEEDKQGKEKASKRSIGTLEIHNKGLDVIIAEMGAIRGTNNGKVRLIRDTFEGWITQ